jgi:predicted NBD/HSP70 family sugar kinase
MSTPPRIGIDLGGTKIELAALGAGGQVLWRERIPTPPEHRYDATFAALVGLVARCEHALGVGGCTVGVGMPGSLARDGRVKNANSTYLNGHAFADDLSAALQRPVRVANDANCMALSEALMGAGQGAEVVFGVILGTGVGGGWVVRGQLLTGANGLAGEWGHTPLPWLTEAEHRSALACYCGQTNCIETWLSGPALAADHARHQPDESANAAADAARIAAGAAAGDPACLATLERYTNRLARALAGVINTVDPDVIVLAGGLSHLTSLYQAVPARWSDHVFSAGSGETPRTRLLPPAHGDASGVFGAAALWDA